MTGYVEPSFPLYEFEPDAPAGRAALRRLWHWNGLVGAPAADVTLAWSDGPAAALVCTSADAFDTPRARFFAAHLALGGTFLPAADRPEGASAIARRMAALRDDGNLWSPIPGLVPEAVRAEGAECNAFTLAYTLFDGGAVFVAAIGIPLQGLAIRIAGA